MNKSTSHRLVVFLGSFFSPAALLQSSNCDVLVALRGPRTRDSLPDLTLDADRCIYVSVSLQVEPSQWRFTSARTAAVTRAQF